MKNLHLLACLCCILMSCQKKKNSVQNVPAHFDSLVGKKLEILIGRQADQRKFTEAIKFPNMSKFGNLPIDSLTSAIYRANNYLSFWNDSVKCHHVIQVLKDSHFDGLIPKDYGIPALERMFEVHFGEKKINDTLKQQAAYWKLEMAITQNYLHYLKDLRFGKANPAVIFKDWDYKRDYVLPYTPAALSMLMNLNFYALVSEFRPQYAMYGVLRSVLYMLDSAKQNKSVTWDAIPYVGKDLIVGDTSWVIPKIKQRLLSVDISHEDKLIHEDTITNVFNGELLTMLNYFQKHVGLAPKWKIDKTTVAALNFTLEKIEDATRVNMERCRWLLKGELPNYYIIVNIADYTLRIYKNNERVYKTKVIVGATNKATPIFHSMMTKVEFNPYWTVPYSIAGAEILPKLKSDPNYLSRNKMELLKDNSVVHLTNFSGYSRRYFPFVVRQKPSEDNSLGQVKFLFPNHYSVYLHDTPSKSLFERDVRAFSHGCIRVQNPMDFAAFLLSEQGVTPEDITEIVNSGKNTPVELKTGIPIIITYWTCFTNKKNEVFFFKDIYGRDKEILKALNKANSLN